MRCILILSFCNPVALAGIEFSVQGFGIYQGNEEHFSGLNWSRDVLSWGNDTRVYSAYSCCHELILERIELWDSAGNKFASGAPNGSANWNGYQITWVTNVIAVNPGSMETRITTLFSPPPSHKYVLEALRISNTTQQDVEIFVRIDEQGKVSLTQSAFVLAGGELIIDAQFDNPFTYQIFYNSETGIKALGAGSGKQVSVEPVVIQNWNGDVFSLNVQSYEQQDVGSAQDTEVPSVAQTETDPVAEPIADIVPQDPQARVAIWQTDAETLNTNQEQRYLGLKEELIKSRNRFSQEFSDSRKRFKEEFGNYNGNQNARQQQSNQLWIKQQQNDAKLMKEMDNNQRARHQENKGLWIAMSDKIETGNQAIVDKLDETLGSNGAVLEQIKNNTGETRDGVNKIVSALGNASDGAEVGSYGLGDSIGFDKTLFGNFQQDSANSVNALINWLPGPQVFPTVNGRKYEYAFDFGEYKGQQFNMNMDLRPYKNWIELVRTLEEALVIIIFIVASVRIVRGGFA